MRTKLLFALLFLGLVALALVVAESRETSRSEVAERLAAAPAAAAAPPPVTPAEDANGPAERTPPAIEIVAPPTAAAATTPADAAREPAAIPGPRAEREPRKAEREAEPAGAEDGWPTFTELVLEDDPAAEEAVVAGLPATLPAEAEIDSAPARVTYRRDPVYVTAGTVVAVELVEPLSSETSLPGDPVRARTLEPLFVDGRLAVPAGSRVLGEVAEARKVKKIGGKARLALDFGTLSVPSSGSWPLAAALAFEGKSESGRDAAAIGGGAAAGAILGRAIKDRKKGKGTLLGAILGAAAGAAIAAETEGEPVDLPAGTRLDLVLDRDLELAIEVQVIES